jgi:glycosyltransferase involved in cell wall biosynthesis
VGRGEAIEQKELMESSLVHLLHLIHDDKEMMNLLIYKMYARDVGAFENFVSFCENNLNSWKQMIRSKNLGRIQGEDEKGDQPVHPILETRLLQPPFNTGLTLEERSNMCVHMRGKRVLVVATQRPGVGGSSTNAYKLTKFMRGLGLRAGLIFFERLSSAPLPSFDPDGIGGVWRMPRFSEMSGVQKNPILRGQYRRDVRAARVSLDRYFEGNVPDVILCKNFVSPLCAKIIYPTDTPVMVYLVSGSAHVTKSGMTPIEFMAEDRTNQERVFEKEFEANRTVDLILPNSAVSYMVFKHVYRRFSDKISPPINTSAFEERGLPPLTFPNDPWTDREFDVAFVVSNLARKVKGPDIGAQVCKRLSELGYHILVIGDGDEHKLCLDFGKCTRMSRLAHADLMTTLSKIKCVIMPSRFDASPNLLTEAVGNGCIPIITSNIGNVETVVQTFVVKSYYDIDAWVSKVKEVLALKNVEGLKYWQVSDFEPLSAKLLTYIHRHVIKIK